MQCHGADKSCSLVLSTYSLYAQWLVLRPWHTHSEWPQRGRGNMQRTRYLTFIWKLAFILNLNRHFSHVINLTRDPSIISIVTTEALWMPPPLMTQQSSLPPALPVFLLSSPPLPRSSSFSWTTMDLEMRYQPPQHEMQLLLLLCKLYLPSNDIIQVPLDRDVDRCLLVGISDHIAQVSLMPLVTSCVSMILLVGIVMSSRWLAVTAINCFLTPHWLLIEKNLI